ncbi:MAG: hypothetical protein JNL70_24955 [Saprospiraceae bacterium]|nr:hypothetical protein [Saprospiraceae bacterium]
MKSFVLILSIILSASYLLSAQKKPKQTEQYLNISTGYVYQRTDRFTIPLNLEYQYRYKRWSIGVGLGFEDRILTWGSLAKLHEEGTVVNGDPLSGGFYPLDGRPYTIQDQTFYIVPSLLVYHYFVKRKTWGLFMRTGIKRPLEIGHAYKAYNYKVTIDSLHQLVVTDKGPNLYKKSDWRINWYYSNVYHWFLGIGFQYQFNNKIKGFILPEVQIQSGLSILGGISFKI